jgi:hypothetical protein
LDLAVHPVPASVTNGSIVAADEVDTFSFTISEALGGGSLTTQLVSTSGTLIPRLTLSGAADQLLIQSDSGRIVQHLRPGTYSLAVSAQAGLGEFELTTQFASSGPPLSPVSVGTLPHSVAISDLNLDGHLDLVASNLLSATVSVMLGNGDGTFQPQQVFATAGRPISVEVADVNRDGRPDLLVVSKNANAVGVFLGNGDGTFQPQSLFAAGLGPRSVVVADLNGDGSFAARNAMSTGESPETAVVADMDGDGFPDLVVANYRGESVSVLLGNGDGSFEPFQNVSMGTDNSGVVVADFDGDGLRDLAQGNFQNDSVTIVPGNGDGTFGAPQVIKLRQNRCSVAVADINGDGIPDMLVPNRGSNDVSVIFGSHTDDGARLGTGGPRLKSGGAGPIAVTVRELTGDGIADLAVTNADSGTVTLLPGVGQGFFDDRQPAALLKLGGALDQPPTFCGTSNIGFAVTTAGDLIHFDLRNPALGASVVFATDRVVAARALPNGQVVVATMDGSVKVLRPEDDHRFVVASQLQARSGTPISPSSLVILQQAGGQFQVFVSSQGSDTVFIFAAVTVPAAQVITQPMALNGAQVTAS